MPAALGLSSLRRASGLYALVAIGAVMQGTIARDVALMIGLVSGSWSLVVFLLMLGRLQRFGFWRTITLYLLTVAFPVGLVLAIRAFMFQPFNIPSAGNDADVSGRRLLLRVSNTPTATPTIRCRTRRRLFSGRIFGVCAAPR